VRIVFMGNVADFTPGILDPLAQRSADPDDPISIAAVVCPAARTGRRESASFRAKRLLGGTLDRVADRSVPEHLRSAVVVGGGVHSNLQRLANRAGAPVWWPRSVNDAELCDQVRKLRADLTIVAGLDRIVREPALSAFPTLFNLHPSMLPEYRGAVPEFWQLDDGLTSGGVTIHRIDPGIDTGPIVAQEAFDIEPWHDSDELIARSVSVGAKLVDRLLDGDPASPSNATPQVGGSYQPIPGPEHYRVPVDRPASGVFNRARAVGFDRALSIDVDADAWRSGHGLRLVDGSGSTVRLDLYEPAAYPEARGGAAGDVLRTHRGGVVVWCASGAVEFRRVAETSSGTGRPA